MKHISVLLFTVCFMLHGTAQITRAYSTQEISLLKVAKRANKTYSQQTFVMAGAAFGVPSSFRLQAGVVKKWGFYMAGTTNFRNYKPQGRDFGESYNSYLWSGNNFYNRWVVHAGPMIRFTPDFMMYFGTGYGRIKILNETVSGHKLYTHHSNILPFSLEADLGLMYRIRRFVISAGFSCGYTGNNNYPAGNIGLGVMF